MTRVTIAEKLRQRLQEKYKIKLRLPKRCYCGHWQRSQGAWSWSATGESGSFELGSQLSMTEVLKLSDEELDKWID